MKEKKEKQKGWRILVWCLAVLVVLGIGAAVYISRNIQGISYSAVLYTVVLDGRRYGATSAKLCQTAGEDILPDGPVEGLIEGHTGGLFQFIG